MKDALVDVCGQSAHMDMDSYPNLEKNDTFTFSCAGCGDCCRGREDIVLSGYDLYRISCQLRLPPPLVVRSFCRQYIGIESGLPVVRLKPIKAEKSSCPFLHHSRCAIHTAKPLVCALYPLGQSIDPDGTVHYFQQKTSCGGQVFQAVVRDYLALYQIEQREPLDAAWAKISMQLSRRVGELAAKNPILAKFAQRKIYTLLYLDYDTTQDYASQFAANCQTLDTVFTQLEAKAAGQQSPS